MPAETQCRWDWVLARRNVVKVGLSDWVLAGEGIFCIGGMATNARMNIYSCIRGYFVAISWPFPKKLLSPFQGFSNIVNPLPGAMPRADLFSPLWGLGIVHNHQFIPCLLSIIHDDKKNILPSLA